MKVKMQCLHPFLEKTKYIISPFFDPKNREKGLAATTVVGLGIAAAAAWLVGVTVAYVVDEASAEIVIGVVSAIDGLIAAVASFFANVANGLLNASLGLFDLSITKDAVFLVAWSSVRGWANMLIVIALIGIAIATILRFKEYAAKKLLVPIIGVALLINFSPVLVGAVIDASNITTKALLRERGGQGQIITSINRSWEAVVRPKGTNIDTVAKVLDYAGHNLLFSAIYFVIGASFLYLALAFLQRHIILIALFILSPLAFVFYVFPLPAAKKLWTDWWHHLIKWCFIGLGGAFFLRLAVGVLSQSPLGGNVTQGSILLKLFIVLGLLVAGMKITKKNSGFISDAVMGVAKTAALGVAVGGAGLLARTGLGAVKATGAPSLALRAGRGLADQFTSISLGAQERLGIKPKGTLEKRRKEVEAARQKPHDELADSRDTKELQQSAMSWNKGGLGGLPKTDQTKREEAAAIKKLATEGKLSLLGNTTAQKEALQHAEKYYGPASSKENREMWDKAKNKNVDLAVYDEHAMAELKLKNEKKKSADGIIEDDATYEKRINKMATRDAVNKADRKFATEATEDDLHEMVDKGGWKGAVATDELIKRELLYTHPNGKNTEDINSLLEHTDYYGLTSRRSYEKQDIRLKGYSEDAERKISSFVGPMMPEDIQKIRDEAVREAAAKLTGNDIAKMPKNILSDQNVMEEVLKSPEKLRFAMARGTNEVREAIAKGIVDDIARNAESMDAGELTEKLSLIPKTDISDYVAESSQKADLRLKFAEKAVPAPTKKVATIEDVTAAKHKVLSEAQYNNMLKTAKAKGLPVPYGTYDEALDYTIKKNYLGRGLMAPAIPKIGDKIETSTTERGEYQKKMQAEGYKRLKERLADLGTDPRNKKEVETIEEFLRTIQSL